MYREFVRELTAGEREKLAADLTRLPTPERWSWTLKWGTIWFAAMSLCGVSTAAIMVLLEPHPFIAGPLVGIVGMAGILFLYAFIMVIGHHRRTRSYVRRFLREDVPEIRLTLDNGKVEAKHVTAAAVIHFEEFEDEGSQWLFDVGDRQTLLFPEVCWFFDEDEPWPNSDFEIVRSKANDRLVGVFCRGTKLKPIRVIERHEVQDEVMLTEREKVIAGDLETVASSLLKT